MALISISSRIFFFLKKTRDDMSDPGENGAEKIRNKELSKNFDSGLFAILNMNIDTASVTAKVKNVENISKEIAKSREVRKQEDLHVKARQSGAAFVDFIGKGIGQKTKNQSKFAKGARGLVGKKQAKSPDKKDIYRMETEVQAQFDD
jgi:hypothetical protein